MQQAAIQSFDVKRCNDELSPEVDLIIFGFDYKFLLHNLFLHNLFQIY